MNRLRVLRKFTEATTSSMCTTFSNMRLGLSLKTEVKNVSEFLYELLINKKKKIFFFLSIYIFLDVVNMSKQQEGKSDQSSLGWKSTSVSMKSRTRTQLRLKRRSGAMDHLMPADGVMEGGEETSAGAKIRTT